jgi:hypothetical protein
MLVEAITAAICDDLRGTPTETARPPQQGVTMPKKKQTTTTIPPTPPAEPRFGRPPQARAVIDRTMSIEQLPMFLTRQELADYLNIGRSSSNDLMQQFGTRLRGCWRISRDLVREILSGRTA